MNFTSILITSILMLIIGVILFIKGLSDSHNQYRLSGFLIFVAGLICLGYAINLGVQKVTQKVNSYKNLLDSSINKFDDIELKDSSGHIILKIDSNTHFKFKVDSSSVKVDSEI